MKDYYFGILVLRRASQSKRVSFRTCLIWKRNERGLVDRLPGTNEEEEGINKCWGSLEMLRYATAASTGA